MSQKATPADITKPQRCIDGRGAGRLIAPFIASHSSAFINAREVADAQTPCRLAGRVVGARDAAVVVGLQQGTAEIGGKVTDEQGAVLPGVAIVVTNEATGVVREIVSGADGGYFASQLVPGRYRIVAKLEGFMTTDRGGLILQVGNTMRINLTLGIGRVQETVTVSAESPLVDTTTAKVGGNIGTAELSELPAMNRNFFATVALLPGVQFSPSNQMGNDTIVAAGQSTQGNNVAVDGGYNSDDALGTSSGAQVRTPLEAIQEFQVITSMYDAEWGRASGAIVNAVTKAGTNQFKGVVFGELAANALTAPDYFVRTQNLEKPTSVRRDWGGVLGGPIVKNKAHFFFSLERQVDNPNRTRVFPTRPELNFAIAEDRTDWNTLIRFDHQINKNNTWAVRWLREWAPQWFTVGTKQTLNSTQDETDLDQTAVGTLTSVLGNSRVNTVRLARTWEHWWHGNECFRAQGPNGGQAGFVFGNETIGNQALCPPQLNYLNFLAQASTESQGPWDSNYQVEDDYSWFLPGKHGDHDMKFGFRYNYTTLRRVSQVNENGTFSFNTDLPFNPANPTTYPERFSIRTGAFEENVKNHTYEVFAQDKWRVTPQTTLSLGVRYDLEIIPLDETGNPLFSTGQKSPTDKNNIAPRLSFTHSMDEAGKSVIRGGYGIFYNRTILGAVDDTLEFGKYTTSAVVTFPANSADPGPSAGRLPTEQYLVNGPTVNRTLLNQAYPPGVPVLNNGVVIFDSPNRTLPYAHQVTLGVRAGARDVTCRPCRLRPGAQQGHVPRAQPQPGAACQHDPHRRAHAVRCVWGAGPALYPASLGDGEHGRRHLQRVEPLARKAVLAQLVRPDLVLAVEVGGHGQRPGRQEPVPDDDRSQRGCVARAEQRGPPAHSVAGCSDGDSENRRDHVVQHRAVHERRAVHDFRQQHRRRSQRRARRSGARRRLQRDRTELHAKCEEQRRAERRGRSRLLPGRCSGRLAAQAQGGKGARGLPRHLQHHGPGEL